MKFYYFNSTHWDREWYQSFQKYRKYLVDMAEDLMECFETEGFEKFCFDGQTIVLKDICELRPELRPQLEKVIKDGRLNVGPWYVMPDEFLVSLEAMIRNLQTGKEVAAEFGGKTWPIGYICDIFGHSSQMPQFLKGFGCDGAVVWRGFDTHCGPKVVWEGADGTRMPTIRLYPINGYGNFTLNVRSGLDIPLEEDEFKQRLTQWVDSTKWHFGDTYIMSDGLDHCFATKEVKKMMEWTHELYPDAEILFSDYRDFFKTEFSDGKVTLPLAIGEQIYPQVDKQSTFQISDTLSSRYDVKLANDLAQNRLELNIEPQAALRAAGHGKKLNISTMRYLWRTLLQNHAHDSICGCSIDDVHRAVLQRIGEVQDLADVVEVDFRNQDLKRLTGKKILENIYHHEDDSERYCFSDIAEDGLYTLRFFNAMPGERTETREFTVDFHLHDKKKFPSKQAEPFFYEFVNGFKLYDENGCEVPYTIKNVQRNVCKPFFRADFRFYDSYRIVANLTLRGTGWTSLFLKPYDGGMVRYRSSMLCGRQSADNGILRLDIGKDGTFTVTDHRNGRRVEQFNNFYMNRDLGDGWNHVRPINSARVLDSSKAMVRLTVDSPVRTEFEITRIYFLPKELVYKAGGHENYVGAEESQEFAELAIRTYVAIDQNNDKLTLRTECDNTIKDYRLRMEVPTGINGNYFVSQHGTFLTRKTGRIHGLEGDRYMESERIGMNFDGIAGKRDAKGGVVLLSKGGLHEAGATVEGEGAFFVTLMRAFRRTVNTEGEVDGQLNKHLEWKYQLKFFGPETTNAELYNDMQAFRSEVFNYMWPTASVMLGVKDESFFTTTGKLGISAFKPAADGADKTIILRFVNPSETPVSETVTFVKPFVKAVLCRLDETEEQALSSVGNNTLTVTAGPNKYLTVKVVF